MLLNEDEMSLDEVCKILSISLATGHNWVKLNKITPLRNSGKSAIFSRKLIIQLSEDIQNSSTKVLKSRRNKKKVKGKKIYTDYLNGSENNKAINDLIECLPSDIDDRHLCILLANTVLQFDKQLSDNKNEDTSNLIKDFISGSYNTKIPECLIFDLINSCKDCLKVISEIEDALNVPFIYSSEDDVLGFVYMSIQNLGSKKAAGAYYTPAKTVNHLIEILGKSTNLTNKSCYDPCCGSGNFLLCYANTTNNPYNIYGQDNDRLAVALVRINFALKYDITDTTFLYEHFSVGDSLQSSQKRKYDIILGNPPWGYEFTQEDLCVLNKIYDTATGTGTESYDLFVEKALCDLPAGGMLAFVLPEAIFNVKTHKKVRELMIEKGTFNFVSYIGNVFPDVQCPAVVLGVKKGKTKTDIQVYCNKQHYTVSGKRDFCPENINLRTSDKAQQCLDKITDPRGKMYLKDNAVFALGIVTGNNKEMVLDTCEAGCEIVLKGSDIRKYKWDAGGKYIMFAPEQFQQVAPAEIYRAPEKLLYRFICESPVFAYDNKQTLSLNSCNILIPQIDGLPIKYILAILNSRVVDFFCNQTFNSIKLLRSHIEKIPVPVPSNDIICQIVDYVDKILSDKTQISHIYEEIDCIVMDIYNLSADEKALIFLSCDERNEFLS